MCHCGTLQAIRQLTAIMVQFRTYLQSNTEFQYNSLVISHESLVLSLIAWPIPLLMSTEKQQNESVHSAKHTIFILLLFCLQIVFELQTRRLKERLKLFMKITLRYLINVPPSFIFFLLLFSPPCFSSRYPYVYQF